MGLQYLGKYGLGKAYVTLFYEPSSCVIVSALSCDGVSVVQAFKRLVLREGLLKKGIDLTQLQSLLSAHSANLEIHTTKPSNELVEKVSPAKPSDLKWLEYALRKLEDEIRLAEERYDKWRGVRDVDEAHQHLSKRHDEIFDLNQKLIANAKEPHFVYAPGKWLPSEWQRTDRVRLNELKDQAKEKASSLRSRLDFTYRRRIQELEAKRRDLLREIEQERKAETEDAKRLSELYEESTAVLAIVTIRSQPILARGRIGSAVRAAAAEVEAEARAFQSRAKDRLSLRFVQADAAAVLGALYTPQLLDVRSAELLPFQSAVRTSLGLTDAVDFQKSLTKAIVAHLGRVKLEPQVSDLSKFPKAAEGKRLAYLGLALDSSLDTRTIPVFYDLDEQGPRHTAIVGGSGSGKSVAASLIVEGALSHNIPAIIFDPTRSWTGLAQKCDAPKLLERYADFGMKPEWARAFDVRILDPRSLGDVDLDELRTPGRASVFTSADLAEDEEASLVSSLLNKLYGTIKSWPESKTLRLMLVFEEAHRYLKNRTLENVLELFARTARSRGVGLLVVSQVAVDLPPAIRNNVATKAQLFSNYAPDLTRAGQTFGSDVQKLIPRLKQAQGALQYPEYGSTLVAFRPPLHSPFALSEEAWQFHAATTDLKEILAVLVAQRDATNVADAAQRTQMAANEHAEPLGEQTTRDWRGVATELTRQSQILSAPELLEQIRAQGSAPPTLRTLQRFLKAMR